MGGGEGGGSPGSGCLGIFLRIFSEPCLTSTALKYVSTRSSGLSVGTKCEAPRTSQFFWVSLAEATRPVTTVQLGTIHPVASSCILTTSYFLPRVFWPPFPVHLHRRLRLGDSASPSHVSQASPAFGRAGGVGRYLGSMYTLPRNREGSPHSCSPAVWPKPHCHHQCSGGVCCLSVFPQGGLFSLCLFLLLPQTVPERGMK